MSSRARQVLEAEGFGKRASEARQLFEARGYPVPSQAWLAAKASSYLSEDSISQPTVGSWLAGKSIPETPMRAWAFARALGVDPGWLVFGEETAVEDPTTVRYDALNELPMAPREEIPRKPSSKRGKRA